MVRRMVFVQVAVGQGSLEDGIISRSLDAPEPSPIFQGLAPPHGLTLVEVGYPPKSTGENESIRE
jgi:tRNA U38,U39,U40 pseudouridine synthase TruA